VLPADESVVANFGVQLASPLVVEKWMVVELGLS
jgi:hypothetical protein